VIIKLLLVAGVVTAAMFAYRGAPGARSLAVRRVAFSGVVVAALVAVIAPQLVTHVANLVGVGRGADLVLYFFVVASMFVWVGLYRRLHDMEHRFVELNRAIALSAVTIASTGGQAGDAAPAELPSASPTRR
jgi:hypothetical protein